MSRLMLCFFIHLGGGALLICWVLQHLANKCTTTSRLSARWVATCNNTCFWGWFRAEKFAMVLFRRATVRKKRGMRSKWRVEWCNAPPLRYIDFPKLDYFGKNRWRSQSCLEGMAILCCPPLLFSRRTSGPRSAQKQTCVAITSGGPAPTKTCMPRAILSTMVSSQMSGGDGDHASDHENFRRSHANP